MSAIERFQPKVLAVFDKPIAPIMGALATGNKLRKKYKHATMNWSLPHRAHAVCTAKHVRDNTLADFLQADAVVGGLCWDARRPRIEQSDAHKLLSALYRRLGMKAGDEMAGLLEGALDMLCGDEIGEASGLWKPLGVSPAILALACRKLIATAIYPPKPAEVRAACKEAADMISSAERVADRLVEDVRKADAILLQFSYDEWERLWIMPQHRPALARMLKFHSTYGDESEEFDEQFEDHPFMRLVEREQAKLAIEQPTEPKRLAAARARPDVKRSKQP
jgi:hypothetical protein